MLYNVPIEPLEERYSAQWQRWFKREFRNREIEFVDVNPPVLSNKIESGRFLDIYNTNFYKADQTKVLSRLGSEFREKDVFFFHDLWHPGVVSLAYMLHCSGLRKKVKICGCLHAGAYDPWDFLAQAQTESWAKGFEESIFDIADEIFVATNFHKELILKSRKCSSEKIVVTKFPFFNETEIREFPKDIDVVFPHRLDVEKRPKTFDEIAKVFPGKKFVKTKEVCQNKKDYYRTLKKSKVSVSLALQETWGIAMIESIFSDCFPIVPDMLSYHELYPEEFRYQKISELISKINLFLNPSKELVEAREKLKFKFEKSAEQAMEAICGRLQANDVP